MIADIDKMTDNEIYEYFTELDKNEKKGFQNINLL